MHSETRQSRCAQLHTLKPTHTTNGSALTRSPIMIQEESLPISIAVFCKVLKAVAWLCEARRPLANERCSRQALFGCGFAAMVIVCLQLNLGVRPTIFQ